MKKVFSYFLTLVLMSGSFTLVSCGDDKDEPDAVENPSESQDVLSNTIWQGNVDGVTVTLSFRTNGRAQETAFGETTTGRYRVSGNKLEWDVDDSILRDSYGPSYTFTMSGSRLVLKNTLGEVLTFYLQ